MKYVIHILIGILLLQPVAVLAASEGPNGPSAITTNNTSPDYDWSNSSNVALSDDSYATHLLRTSTDELQTSNFGFSIPSTATINGILLQIERRVVNSISADTGDSTIRILKAATRIGDDKATVTDWSTSDEVVGYGGISDLWGTAWTSADINDSDFGAVIAPYSGAIGGKNDTFYVDHIQITVYYTAASGVSRGNAGKTLRLKQKRSAGYVRSDVVPPTPQEVGIFRYLEQEDPVLVTAKQEREALQQLRVYEARKATVVQEIPPPRLVRLEKKKMEYAQGNRVQALHAAAVEKEVPAMCGRVEKRLRGKSEEVKARAWKRVRMRSGYSCSLYGIAKY